MKSKTRKSKMTSPTVDEARAEVARADANARAAKEKVRSTKSSLKAVKKAMKLVEKVAKKARKEARRARKQLEALLARQRAHKKTTVARKRARRVKPPRTKPVAAPLVSRGGAGATVSAAATLAPVDPPL